MALSVIDLVRYNLRPMVNEANYAALYKASGLALAAALAPRLSKLVAPSWCGSSSTPPAKRSPPRARS